MSRNKRRANGEGTIRRRKDGRWEGRVSLQGIGKTRVVYGKTKIEVSEKIQNLRVDNARGLVVAGPKVTLEVYVENWLQNIQRPAVSRNHFINLEGLWRKHLKPRIGKVKLSEIRPDHIDYLFASMDEDGLSLARREKSYALLSTVFSHAIERRDIALNPLNGVRKPRAPKPEVGSFSAEEAKTILDTSRGGPHEALVAIALNAGLREGELFALQWQDVDLREGVLTVRRSQRETSGHLYVSTTKTESVRRVSLGPDTLASLKRHRESLGAVPIRNYRVFTSPGRMPLRRSNFTRRCWKPLLEKAGVAYQPFKTCRSTMATLSARAGVNPKVVQAQLGHAKIETTLAFYTAVNADQQAEAARDLEAAIAASA